MSLWKGNDQRLVGQRHDVQSRHWRLEPGETKIDSAGAERVEQTLAIGALEAQLDVGIALAERRDDAREHMEFGGMVMADPQLAALGLGRLLSQRDAALRERQEFPRLGKKHQPGFCQLDPAAGALEQRCADIVLEFLDLNAERRQ